MFNKIATRPSSNIAEERGIGRQSSQFDNNDAYEVSFSCYLIGFERVDGKYLHNFSPQSSRHFHTNQGWKVTEERRLTLSVS